MAKLKELKLRIKAVKNTSKITRTMEMISRSRAAKLLSKEQAMRPYMQKLNRVVDTLYLSSGDEENVLHPLQMPKSETKKVILFAITASRGLCGTYSAHIIDSVKDRLEHHYSYGREVLLHVIGKKGVSYFQANKIPIARTYPRIDENSTYEDCEAIMQRLMHQYIEGDVDRIEVVYTRYYTRVAQIPKIKGLIPIVEDDENIEGARKKQRIEYLIEPNRRTILGDIIPLAIKTSFYNMINNSFLSENAQRSIAMRSATDNAEKLVGKLSMEANRKRQEQITTELLDIIGGTEAAK